MLLPRFALLAALSAVALSAAACSSGSTSTQPAGGGTGKDATAIAGGTAVAGNRVNITTNGDELAFQPAIVTVAGGPVSVTLTFKNGAATPTLKHNVLVVKDGTADEVTKAGATAGESNFYVPDDSNVLISTRLVSPGLTEVLSFLAPPAGKYQYICTVPGHTAMRGDLIVQ